ncbi:hypothetical protein Gohar_021129 [Gossypium harknessii]|uniref:RNase H type-1 domain-containing protein n=1 Tax=Gossypium harknessii TaxID=34285 RepID=A0A7J9IDM8_9ROSI|nr:hypothetical protein [Gossypium harknessii]
MRSCRKGYGIQRKRFGGYHESFRVHKGLECSYGLSLNIDYLPVQRWQEGEYDWVRMNTDFLIKAEDAFAAAGGILVDHNGRWIIGFTRYLGNCAVLDSEL